MSQFAYEARNAAGTDALTPANWVFGWQYPDDAQSTGYPTTPVAGGQIPGLPFPPGWPRAAPAALVLNMNAPANMSLATHTGSFECWLTVGGVEAAASVLANHLIMVTCSEISAGTGVRNLRKSGGAAYVTAIYYKVTNYAGNRWGFLKTIDVDPSGMTALDVFDMDGKCVTVIANPDGDDQFNIVS